MCDLCVIYICVLPAASAQATEKYFADMIRKFTLLPAGEPESAMLALNGFVYHLQARQGDSQKNEIAIEGYQQAMRIDSGNWIAF